MMFYQFLRMAEHEQQLFLNRIIEKAQKMPDDQWHTVDETPPKPDYYPVIAQYGKHISTRRKGVARWSGTHWCDCYDNIKTTGGRYSAWDVKAWALGGNDDTDSQSKKRISV